MFGLREPLLYKRLTEFSSIDWIVLRLSCYMTSHISCFNHPNSEHRLLFDKRFQLTNLGIISAAVNSP